MKEFDYTPLTESITPEVQKQYTSSIFGRQSYIVLFVFIFIGVTVGPFAVFSLTALHDEIGGLISLLPVLIITFIGIVAIIMVRSQRIATAQRRARLAHFAEKNGMTFAYGIKDPTKAGMIFNEGYDREIAYELGGSSSSSYLMGNYKYITGSGKNRQEHTFGYMQLMLPRRLPHMLLDAKSNNFWMFSNLPATINSNQILSLEGDFDTYFTLYAPKEYERDALYIFTPDVMQHLIHTGQEFDMEIIDDQLFIYSNKPFDLEKEDVLKKLFAVIAKIGTELGAQTDYYADERIGDRSVNLIAPEGIRLKSGVNWLVIIVIVLYLGFYFGGFLIDIVSSFN